MTGEQNHNYSYMTEALKAELGFLQSPEWKKTRELMYEGMSSAIKQFCESDAMKAAAKMATEMQNLANELSKIVIPQIESLQETKKGFEKLYYLGMLEKIQWPFFLYIDEELIERLAPYKNVENPDQTELMEVFISFADEDFLNTIVHGWEQTDSINCKRLPALKEAISLYKGGQYYGCTALLLCQLEGVISDAYSVQTKSGRQFTVDDLRTAYEHYNPNKSAPNNLKMTSEKNQLLAMASEIDGRFFYWVIAVGYLYQIVFTSSDEMNESRHPCRNKVCHGIQINYGTQEHALKSILVIDLAIQLSEDMKRIIEEQEDKDD